ncbi:MAG: D-tyrosyl-tRNA(Tyr) deacylase [Chitinophagaceae bacterium]|nr:MAG: D-tyrosyl-tRNA(Tyr) deacylase [Chitinophagaceae bacterium]
MRAIVQRVTEASVEVDGSIAGSIAAGLLVLVGVEDADAAADAEWLAAKICSLRIFSDSEGLMNLSLRDNGGDVLAISQFTLHAAVKKGNRPSFIRAAKPPVAIPLYQAFIAALERELGKPPATGIFGADMKVRLLNDGPVTLFIDTQNKE